MHPEIAAAIVIAGVGITTCLVSIALLIVQRPKTVRRGRQPMRPEMYGGKRPKPDGPGHWRFSRFDGRFVFDYDDGRTGFASPTAYDVGPFAKYVDALEADLAKELCARR